MKISACYIVKNDEEVLKRSLESIKNCVDEIIVVDTGAEDGTRKVAESFGARLFDFAWCDDFAAARNAALTQATGNYVVFLDADEYFSKETQANLRRVIENNKTAEAICIDLVNIDQETEENLGDAFALRIFKNDKNFRFVGRIHEQLVREDEKPLEMTFVSPQELLIFHTGYSRALSWEKAERNYRMLMRELETDKHPERLYMYLAEACAGLKQNSEAKKWAFMDINSGRKRVAYASRSYRILIKLLNEEQASFAEKQELLQQAIADFPDVPEFWAELAETQAALFDYSAAISSMNRAIGEADKPMGLEPAQFGSQVVKVGQERLSFWRRIIEREKTMKVSACLIFRDDRKDIGNWLKGAQVYADDIVCVDTGSVDGSAQLCEEAGITPYHFAWCDDFAAARNFALDKATGEYIVFLDADEYLAHPGRLRFLLAEAEIRKIEMDAFMLPLINIDEDDGNREIQRFQAVRVFRNDKLLRYAGRIHEQINKADGVLELRTDNRVEIYHTGYSSARIRRKLERNLALLKAETAENGERPQYHRYLAECYFGLGNYEKALQYGLLAAERNMGVPGSESMGWQVVIQAMRELNISVFEQLEFVRRAAGEFPELPDFFGYQGIIEYELGNKQAAHEPLQKAVKIFEQQQNILESSRFPNFADKVYYYLAEIFKGKGGQEQSRILLRKSLEFNKYYKKALSLLLELEEPRNTAEAVEILSELYGDTEAEFLHNWAEERADWQLSDYYAERMTGQGMADNFQELKDLRTAGNIPQFYRTCIAQMALNMQNLLFLLLQMAEKYPDKRDFVSNRKKLLPQSLQRIFEACSTGKTAILSEDAGIYMMVLPLVIRYGDDNLLRKYTSVAKTISFELVVKAANILQDNSLWAEALELYQEIPADSPAVTADFWYGAGVCLYHLRDFENARSALTRAKTAGGVYMDIEAYLKWIDEGCCND